MSNLPKLRIKLPFGNPDEEIVDLEQARYRFHFGGDMVVLMIDGQAPQTYEELVQMVSQDKYKDKEFIDAEMLVDAATGG
jgi:hypothetical protein